MPDTSQSPKRYRALAIWTLVTIAVSATIWLAAIAWWRATQQTVSNRELAICLIVLPLAAIGTFAALSMLLKHRKNRIKAVEPILPSAEPPESQSSPRAAPLPILAAWAVTSVATDGNELVDALAGRTARPVPDMLLTDEQGFPVLASRVPELDLLPIETMLAAHISEAQTASQHDIDSYSAACLRAVALLAAMLDRVLDDWPLQDIDSTMQERADRTATLRGSSGLSSEAVRPFIVQVKLLVAASLQAHEQAFARACLENRLAPLETRRYRFQIELVAGDDDASALNMVSRFSRASDAAPDQALLLLACDSTLCPQIAEEWAATGRLFSSRQPNGLMMGEAAFGILCVRAAVQEHALTAPICHLSSVQGARRTASADLPGKPSSVCLKEQIAKAMDASGIGRDDIGGVVCDADHRNGRTLECIGAMIDQTPGLDAIQDRLAISEGCGHLGAASTAGVLAVAALQAARTERPVLLFNVSHSIDRAAAVMIPSQRIDAAHPPEHLHAA
jgi:hypothetical protein